MGARDFWRDYSKYLKYLACWGKYSHKLYHKRQTTYTTVGCSLLSIAFFIIVMSSAIGLLYQALTNP